MKSEPGMYQQVQIKTTTSQYLLERCGLALDEKQ